MKLGRFIRASRLGWYVAEPMKAWMRISDGRFGLIVVELAPLDDLPPAHSSNKEFRCIGEGRGGSSVFPELIPLSPVLSNIRVVKQPIILVLTELGRLAS